MVVVMGGNGDGGIVPSSLNSRVVLTENRFRQLNLAGRYGRVAAAVSSTLQYLHIRRREPTNLAASALCL